ncbi:formate dehydrogenase subunit gamma [Halomonas heilongjiangensis]|uniref:Formate dehydrogenase subunit gamma n=2 Tax=Halomonas heilongjiangensis TaxID=1387883 RepID=A0A2N7TR09_9GAMM|nr:formate dehydrogenase subunit gamma [Halomonas heilongjiangensis]PMR70624.1 formate dehydrogenase subunit gamma [Halomonas heilongjiangensis]PXX88820.1 formate dehydrogenase subunit gamma [Halomonas heilongjiangensis]
MFVSHAWPGLWRMAALALVLLVGLGVTQPALAQADPDREAATAVGGVSPETWRQVRSGETGPNFRDSRAESTYNLVNASGETWRQLRNRWVSPFGLIAIGGMLVVIALFYVIVGRKDLSAPRTGRKLLRWPLVVRAIHWTVATLFIVLALTGLNLLYGKFVFRPLFGDAVWAGMISASKVAHNYLGPLFGILLIVLLARVLKHNWPKKHDLEWFKKGGGMVGKAHVDAGFANGGEKVWFWLLATVGIVVIASGFVLDFPNYGQGRDTMQWANIIHAVGALGLTAVALGHIYIGTIGSEGSLEGMATGYVDETWARDHHNLWYEEVKDQAIPEERLAAGGQPSGGSEEPTPRSG